MNSRGVTMIELVLVGTLMAVAALLSSASVLSLFKGSESVRTLGSLEGQALAAQKHIQRAGRVARFCQRISATELQCGLDFSPNAAGPLVGVRFILGASVLNYERCDGSYSSATGCSGGWIPQLSYQGIAGFHVCGTLEFDSNRCPELPQGLTQIRTLARGAGANDNRFFQFQITTTSPRSVRLSPSDVQLRGAFYVRNTPSGSDLGSYTYLWTGENE